MPTNEDPTGGVGKDVFSHLARLREKFRELRELLGEIEDAFKELDALRDEDDDAQP